MLITYFMISFALAYMIFFFFISTVYAQTLQPCEQTVEIEFGSYFLLKTTLISEFALFVVEKFTGSEYCDSKKEMEVVEIIIIIIPYANCIFVILL